jgi:hypothetical protein
MGLPRGSGVSSNGCMQSMRRVVRRLALISAGVGLVLAANTAHAQGSCTFTDENGKTVTWPNCQPPADTKNPAANGSAPAAAPAPGIGPPKSFPYPGETPAVAPATPNAPVGQNTTGNPSAPGSSAQPGGNSAAPAGKRFPYPGEDSSGDAAKDGANPAAGDGMKDAGSSGSSSSSSSSDSDSDAGAVGPLAGDDDPAAKAAEARRTARKNKGSGFNQAPDDRELEDLKVAAFYQNDGNFRGAYARATDAVSIAGDDAEAQLALADAARRLGKLDEAETHYKKCLTLDPVPKVKKAAEKALQEMSGGM